MNIAVMSKAGPAEVDLSSLAYSTRENRVKYEAKTDQPPHEPEPEPVPQGGLHGLFMGTARRLMGLQQKYLPKHRSHPQPDKGPLAHEVLDICSCDRILRLSDQRSVTAVTLSDNGLGVLSHNYVLSTLTAVVVKRDESSDDEEEAAVFGEEGSVPRFWNQTVPQAQVDSVVYQFVMSRCSSQALYAISTNGQLFRFASPSFQRRAPGRRVACNITEKIVSVDCGLNNVLVLTEEGNLFAWGLNQYGQAGVDPSDDALLEISQPTRVQLPNVKVESIACGMAHCCAVTDQGQLYTWGWGKHGQLGHGDTDNQSQPRQVTAFRATKVVSVAAGGAHTLVLDANKTLFAFGLNDSGQLGLYSLKNAYLSGRKTTKSVDSAVDVKEEKHYEEKIDEAPGTGAHQALLSKPTLGKYEPLPCAVEALTKVTITDFSCGMYHSVVVSEGGRAYVFGQGQQGQLNGIPCQSLFAPTPLVLEGKTQLYTRLHCGDFSTTLQYFRSPIIRVSKETVAGDLAALLPDSNSDICGLYADAWLRARDDDQSVAVHKCIIMARCPALYQLIVSLEEEKKQEDFSTSLHEERKSVSTPHVASQPDHPSGLMVATVAHPEKLTGFKQDSGGLNTGDGDDDMMGLDEELDLQEAASSHVQASVSSGHVTLIIPNCVHGTLLELVRYIYTGQCNVTEENSAQLELLAGEFDLYPLQNLARGDKSASTTDSESVAMDISKLLQPSTPADVELLAPVEAPIANLVTNPVPEKTERKQVPAHRVILAARSQHFRALLSSPFGHSSDREVRIDDFSFECLQHMLRFIYTGAVDNSMTISSKVELMVASDMYGLTQLKDLLQESLYESINPANFAWCLLAANTFQADQLRRACIFYASQNYDRVHSTHQFTLLPETLRAEIRRERATTMSSHQHDGCMIA